MPKTWIVFDVPYLAYRAFYSTGSLRYAGAATGTAYGVLSEVSRLAGRLGSQNLAFAFDSKRSLRKDEFPWYKANRAAHGPKDPEREQSVREMRKQVHELRAEHLPALGYANVLHADGYEADDCIASFCANLGRADAVVVSADEDLYQLLSPSVRLYKPQTRLVYSESDFRREFPGIGPADWPRVKALAGCASDNVRGAFGVGPQFAARYLAGAMNKLGKTYKKVVAFDGTEACDNNLRACKLPYPDCPEFRPLRASQSPDPNAWDVLMGRLGITTVHPPAKSVAAETPKLF